MLITPLGELLVLKNNIPIEYNLIKLPLKPIDICSYEVDERYLIEIDKSTIKCGDTISYNLNTIIKPEKDVGECLIEAMFESDDLFLGIGGYDINDQNETYNFGHSFHMIEKGIEAKIIDLKYIEDLLVAISWCNTSVDDCYTSVWFSSDPTI